MRIFNRVRFRAWFLSLLVCGFWQSYATAGLITFGTGSNQFTMNFVDIGNAGNAADTTGDPSRAGAVGYAYGLGEYEVSEDMITKFNASQSLQITKDTRGVDKPATSVSWNEAARFTNWLNTSTGGSAAYKFTIGSGVNDNIALWGSGDAGYDALNPYRNSLATYVLPSMDEWYKAAYYNPTTSTYSNFPNGSDTAPTAVASGTGVGTAVYAQTFAQGPADITSAGGLSPYGIMGLGGNVFEWEETSLDLNNSSGSSDRGIRGGFWLSLSNNLSSSTRFSDNPADGSSDVVFRVASVSSSAASVPEPGTFGVLSFVGLALVAYRKRMKK